MMSLNELYESTKVLSDDFIIREIYELLIEGLRFTLLSEQCKYFTERTLCPSLDEDKFLFDKKIKPCQCAIYCIIYRYILRSSQFSQGKLFNSYDLKLWTKFKKTEKE